jgi:hypothetical protein
MNKGLATKVVVLGINNCYRTKFACGIITSEPTFCGVIARWPTQEIPILEPKTTVRSPITESVGGSLSGPILNKYFEAPDQG